MNTKFIQTNAQFKIIIVLLITILTSFSVFSQTPPNQQNALNATGNVGVGTISPDSKLQVNGSMSIDSSLTVRDTAIFEKQARMKDKVIVEGEAVIQGKLTAQDNLKVLGTTRIEGPLKLINLNNAQSDDTTFLLVDANGKVKSASFPTVLNVMSANPQAASILANIVYGTLPFQCYVGYQPIWYNEPEILWTGTNNCPARVGIMTDNPAYQLDVYGTTQTSNFIIRNHTFDKIFHSYDVSSTVKFLMIDGPFTTLSFKAPNSPNTNGDWGVEYNAGDGGLNFWKPWPNNHGSGNYYLFLKDNGNVGIGTKDAKYKLSVEGRIGARGITVELTSWADYVFEKAYKLLPLNEVEQFIKVNGHLPDVPSAKEIEEKGLDLGETNKILMQKVEELTLHLIAQEKRIVALENELNNCSDSTKTTAP